MEEEEPNLVGASRIRPYLYLGSIDSVRYIDKSWWVLSIVVEKPTGEHLVREKHLHISLRDSPGEPLGPWLGKGVEFIEAAIEKENNILVHCEYGISRSASFVIAYIIKHDKVHFEDALSVVKQRRSVVCPNPGFAHALMEFAKQTNSGVTNPSSTPLLYAIVNGGENNNYNSWIISSKEQLIMEIEECLDAYGSASARDVQLRNNLGEMLKRQAAWKDIVVQAITEVKNANNIDLPRLPQYCNELLNIVLLS